MPELREYAEQEKDKLSRKIRIGCFIILAVIMLGVVFILVCESEDDHCTLEYLDNLQEGMPSINRAIRQQIEKPESFQHVSTNLEFPGDGSGPNRVWVDFLTIDDSGILSDGNALAFIDGSSDSCVVNDIAIRIGR